MLRILFACLWMLFVGQITNAQQQITADNLLDQASKAIQSLASVEYDLLIFRKNDTLEVSVIQQRSEAEDIGFGNAMIKVSGKQLVNGDTIDFSFSYDSARFTYQFDQTEIFISSARNRETLAMEVGEEYLSAFVYEFGSPSGLEPFLQADYKLLYNGWKEVNGEDTYAITMIRSYSDPSTGRRSKLISEWAFSESSHLPLLIKREDGTTTTISYIETNKKYSQKEFAIEGFEAFEEEKKRRKKKR